MNIQDGADRQVLNGLQVVRLAAATAVVVFHAVHYALAAKVISGDATTDSPYIFDIGVYMLFAVSGFFMGKLADETTVGRFALHRLLRVYPAFWAAVAVTLCGSFLVLGRIPDFELRTLSLLPFGVVTYPLRVEWTLVYEVFFYCCTALLCALPSPLARRAVVIAWAAAILLALGGPPASTAAMFPTSAEILLSRINLLFVCGMMAWWLRRRAAGHEILLVVAGLALFVMPRLGLAPSWLPKVIWGAVGGSCIVLGASTQRASHLFRRATILVRGGDASFGIYLIHVPVITIFYAKTNLTGPAAPIFAVVLSFLLGGAFGLIEHSVYGRMKRRADRWLFRPPPLIAPEPAPRDVTADRTDAESQAPGTAPSLRLQSPAPRSTVTP